jgi:hypothetical protein
MLEALGVPHPEVDLILGARHPASAGGCGMFAAPSVIVRI